MDPGKLDARIEQAMQALRLPPGDRKAAVLSEVLGSFDVERSYQLGKYVEALSRQEDRVIYT